MVRFTSHLFEYERFVHRRIRIMRLAGCRLGEWLYLPICRDRGTRGHHRLVEKEKPEKTLCLAKEGKKKRKKHPRRGS